MGRSKRWIKQGDKEGEEDVDMKHEKTKQKRREGRMGRKGGKGKKEEGK